MRMNTSKLLEKSWWMLASNQHLNGFESREEFEAEFGTLGEVIGDGRCSFFTRISGNKPFEPGNVQIVNCEQPEDEERVITPFVGGLAG